MNKTDQQQLIKLCEDPQSFIDLVEDWAEHKHPDSFLIKRFFTKHKLFDKIINPRISSNTFMVEGEFINPTHIVFQLKDDPCIYRLFGTFDEHEMVHVVLSRLTLGELPS